jgi:hypothetical protein
MGKHDESQRMVEHLMIGDRIDVRSGAGKVTVIDMGPIQPADNSRYAGLRVLHTTGDQYLPFAEHLLYYQDDGNEGWMMSSGTSYQNLRQAVAGFHGPGRS